jgi:hypothetical protein
MLPAQPGGKWVYLGEANLDGSADHDRIQVGQSKGPFRRIQILVENAEVRFDRVLVRYGVGSSSPVSLASQIRAGGRTREIDLPGDRRWIESVDVWYRRANWSMGRRPKIRLFGIR